MRRLFLILNFLAVNTAILLLPKTVFAQGAATTVSCNGSREAVNTAFGCISFADGGKDFIQNILTLSLGLGGAIGLLLILYGFFTITTSAGIPDKVKAGQQIISSAIMGLLFITLSVVLLNLIGVNILAIPGF